MNLGFCPLASSSAGNCYLIKSESTNILVDIGISGAKIFEKLKELEICPSKIDGILITHEHGDHVRVVKPLVKKADNARFFASAGTIVGMKDKAKDIPEDKLISVSKGEKFYIGDIEINVFGLSHDSMEPVAYYFQKGDKKIAIVTDTGTITEEIEEAIKDADILVMESNHEVNILLYGNYPYHIKHRILSDKGHLSNEAAGKCISKFLKNRKKQRAPYVFLAHLSKENNTPEQAFITVKNMIEEEEFYVDKHLRLQVLAQKETGDFIVI
jgi:phosphoribosyl 1,2-cyclic phosphodiesterase